MRDGEFMIDSSVETVANLGVESFLTIEYKSLSRFAAQDCEINNSWANMFSSKAKLSQ
jgi:hypothetical protein